MDKFNLLALLGGSTLFIASCGPKIDKGVSVDCSGFSFTTEIDAFWTDKAHKTCGHQDRDGVFHISPETMKLFKPDYFEHDFAEWGQKGLRCFPFRMSDGTVDFGYLASDGRARISDDPHGNGCQPFRNDVAISYVHGKAIFFDKDLEVVKATDYALADPFDKHLAKVCTVRPEKEYDSHGEHFEWAGGTCGYIDTEFKAVVPIETPYESTKRLTGGKYEGE